jgi:hypothetical protein
VPVTLKLRTRLLRAEDGSISDGEETFNNIAAGDSTTVKFVAMTEGFLLSAAIECTTATFQRGGVFCQLELCHGSQQDVRVDQVLLQDFPSTLAAITFPGGLIRAATEGPGQLSSVAVANPGNGTEFNLLATGFRRRLLSQLSCTFTTSAIAGNRVPTLSGNDGAGTFFNFIPVAAAIPPSTTAHLLWMAGGVTPTTFAAGALGTLQVMPLPTPYYFGQLTGLGSKTAALDVGDAYTQIIYLFQDWPGN